MISKESYNKGVRCKGMCFDCKDKKACYQYKIDGQFGIEPTYEPPKNPINNTAVNKTTISADVIAEILNNPNVESVSINYERVGEKENLNIDIKRK